MSNSRRTTTGEAELTEKEQNLFERLADRYEGEATGRIAEIALAGSDGHSSDGREETN